MTASFVHVDIPAGHAGVARAEALIGRLRRNLKGGRGWAALLMAVIVASLLVAADGFVTAAPEGELLLLAWVLLCGAAFVGLAMFTGLTGAVSRYFAGAIERSRRRRADNQMMELALRDPRIMRELQAIASRQEAE
jgi:hypothetical protein